MPVTINTAKKNLFHGNTNIVEEAGVRHEYVGLSGNVVAADTGTYQTSLKTLNAVIGTGRDITYTFNSATGVITWTTKTTDTALAIDIVLVGQI